MEDLVKVIADTKKTKHADTGQFKCIFKGNTVPDKPPTMGLNLMLEGKAIKRWIY